MALKYISNQAAKNKKSIHHKGITVVVLCVILVGFIVAGCSHSEATDDRQQGTAQIENVILVTVDGLRWQELFSGADSLLIGHEDYVRNADQLSVDFWHDDPLVRRELLLPFFWNTISEQGQIYGNRWLNNNMDLTNEYRFSYPGYSELLVGYADPEMDSNAKRWNPNTTVLEFIHNQPGFEGRVAAFASWDVFPWIINSERSGIPVHAGFEPVPGDDLTDRQKLLNEMLSQIPRPWNSVRHNAFTFHYAMEHLKTEQPRLLYIAFDETDEFAHSGNFQEYLYSARQFDAFVEELWVTLQNNEHYKDKTALVVATDHGRGTEPLDHWRHHGANIDGAEEVWMAAMGPGIPALGEVSEPMQLYQNQIAATVAALLGVVYESELPVGESVDLKMD